MQSFHERLERNRDSRRCRRVVVVIVILATLTNLVNIMMISTLVNQLCTQFNHGFQFHTRCKSIMNASKTTSWRDMLLGIVLFVVGKTRIVFVLVVWVVVRRTDHGMTVQKPRNIDSFEGHGSHCPSSRRELFFVRRRRRRSIGHLIQSHDDGQDLIRCQNMDDATGIAIRCCSSSSSSIDVIAVVVIP